MSKLSKSTIALIILAIAAIILGVVLFLNIPESWTENFGSGQRFAMGAGDQHIFKGNLDKQGLRGGYSQGGHGGIFPFGFIFIVGLIIFVVTKRNRFGGRKNHGQAILDQMFAEEKIGEEEYNRKKTIMEEE